MITSYCEIVDGCATIAINPEGLPASECVVPAPLVSESERALEVQEQIDALYMRGYFITSQKRVRNPAFDESSQQTTTKISFRICKTQDEAEFVLGKIKEMVEQEVK